MNRTGLPWLEPLEAELAAQVDSGQLAHALLVHGQRGTGKRRLAAWLAQELLGSDRAVWPAESAPETTLHANLHPAAPETGKLLSVERIRELIDFMLLSTYGSGARVAAICPAESMTRSAANSLLKILEEPRPGELHPPGCRRSGTTAGHDHQPLPPAAFAGSPPGHGACLALPSRNRARTGTTRCGWPEADRSRRGNCMPTAWTNAPGR